MNKKKLTVALAGVATAGVLSAGTAQADVPVFATPFVDPGCLCAGLLPAPVEMGADNAGSLPEHYIWGNLTGPNWDAAATVRYFTAPTGAISILELGNDAAEVYGPVQYGSYRGHPSFTTGVTYIAEYDQYEQLTVLVDGPRVVMLRGVGFTPSDAIGALATLSNTFQII